MVIDGGVEIEDPSNRAREQATAAHHRIVHDLSLSELPVQIIKASKSLGSNGLANSKLRRGRLKSTALGFEGKKRRSFAAAEERKRIKERLEELNATQTEKGLRFADQMEVFVYFILQITTSSTQPKNKNKNKNHLILIFI